MDPILNIFWIVLVPFFKDGKDLYFYFFWLGGVLDCVFPVRAESSSGHSQLEPIAQVSKCERLWFFVLFLFCSAPSALGGRAALE